MSTRNPMLIQVPAVHCRVETSLYIPQHTEKQAPEVFAPGEPIDHSCQIPGRGKTFIDFSTMIVWPAVDSGLYPVARTAELSCWNDRDMPIMINSETRTRQEQHQQQQYNNMLGFPSLRRWPLHARHGLGRKGSVMTRLPRLAV